MLEAEDADKCSDDCGDYYREARSDMLFEPRDIVEKARYDACNQGAYSDLAIEMNIP